MLSGLKVLRLDVPPPRMDMRVEMPVLRLRQELPALRIDVRFALEDLGLRSNKTLARLYATLGREAALRETVRAAQEGDRLREGPDVFSLAEAAVLRSTPRARELNVDVAPKTRVVVEVDPGSVHVDVSMGRVRVDVPFPAVDVGLVDAEVGLEPGTRVDLRA